MSWKVEIIRAFFVAFGAFEVIANVSYLRKENGLVLARKQHRELPDSITDLQIKTKTICMFVFGCLLLFVGMFSYITHSYNELLFVGVLGLYMIYAFIEFAYYKFYRTFGAFVLSLVLLLVVFFL